MYILELDQGENRVNLCLFESLEEGREFVCKIPGYQREEVDGFTHEYLLPDQLPDYLEVTCNRHRVPLTRYMFPEAERVDIYWQAVPNLSEPGEGLVAGVTRVDAYVIPNAELQDYLEKRERAYARVEQVLTAKGCEVSRSFLGSEDGEAILYRCDPREDWHFLTHLDPGFVESSDPEGDLAELLEEMEPAHRENLPN